MRWWVCAFLLAASVFAAPATKILAVAQITSELRASLVSDYSIDVIVLPHEGDAWTRLAKRVTGDAENWRAIAAMNDEKLNTDVAVHVPLKMLRPELQRQILSTLFPKDSSTDSGWKHLVIGAIGGEGESLWNIAEWLTGSGENYIAIRKANPLQGLSTRPGDVVLIPKQVLAPGFGGDREGLNVSTKTAEVRKSEDDPIEHAPAGSPAEDVAVEAVATGQPALSYEKSTSEPYAVYRLQKGEALYSSVAIRFTGRVYAKDVGDVVDRIVQFNCIDDVARIPVGYSVKIPMALVLPEYRPPDDPARVAAEITKRESAKLARRTRASGLAGVHIILDAGHGGSDPGAIYEEVTEAGNVYDVMSRLKELLEKKTAARISVTRDEQFVLTSPRYELGDPVVGVNLRWYLANSMFRRAIHKGIPKEKIVFLSIHADSLHPSLRGAMAYIPAERFVTGSYRKTEDVYLARAEVREHPVVRHSEEESLEAEGLSRDLAESIIDAFDRNHLKVHPFNPVRDNVVRDGREWVPAIIRYNLVPTRLLLEVCNLGNTKDRALLKTPKYRQQLAASVYEGLIDFFADREESAPPVVARASK